MTRTVSGVFYLRNVFQFIVDRFNQGFFPEQNLVCYTHQRVLHVAFNFCNKLDAVQKEVFKQGLFDTPSVSTQLSLNVFHEPVLLQRLTIIHIAEGKHEVKNFPLVIDYQMQLESEEPAHGTFSTFGKSFKSLVNQDSFVATDTQRSGVNETDARADFQQDFLYENDQLKQYCFP